MKKNNPTARKLALDTTTVAVLADLARVAGGQMAYTKHSVCADQCCVSDYCGGSSGC